MTWAALALAAAVLVHPGAPRRRLTPPGRRRHRYRRVLWVPAAGVAGLTAAAFGAGVAVATALVLATVAARRRRGRARRRRREEGWMLHGALEALVGELRIGAHPVQAFAAAGAEPDASRDPADPVRAGLRAVAHRAHLGADVAAGLRGVGDRSALPAAWYRLAQFWQVADRHGVAIAELMRAAQHDLAERQRFAARMDAGMAGARATATILAGLPVLGLLLGEAIGAAPLAFLTGPGAGGWFLVAGAALTCAGLWWAGRITDRGIP